MSSTERDGGQKISRKNTFRRMLELEKKNKMNRQASTAEPIPSTRISIDRRPGSSPYSNPPPASLQSTGQAMTAPTFPVSIPPIESSTNPSTAVPSSQTINDSWKPGGIYFKDEEDGSDTSSICQSPGWDDSETKNRKKAKKEANEKRRKEKAKAATEAKHAQRVTNRLTKAPPTNKKLEQMAVSMERSSSAPAVQISSEVDRKTENRSRRGSLEIGLKNLFQATQAIPPTWKSAQMPPDQGARPSTDNGEFIGGLKLKLADEAAAQDRFRDLNSTVSSYHSAQGMPIQAPESSNGKSTMQDGLRMHRYNVSKGQPIEQRSVELEQVTSTLTPVMDRKIKRNRENIDTISDHRGTRTVELAVVSGQNSPGLNNFSDLALFRPGSNHGKSNQTSNTTSAFSPERTCFTHREAPMEAPRGRSGVVSYVQTQRRQSRDRSVAGFEDEYLVSGANPAVSNCPPSQGGSFPYASTRSHGRSWSEATASTRLSKNGNNGQNSSQERVRMEISLRKDPTHPQSDFIQHHPGSTSIECSVNAPKTTKSASIVPVLRGFRTAATVTFSSPSSVATSPTSLFYPNDIKTSNQIRPGLSRCISTVSTVKSSELPLGKTSRVQGPSTSSDLQYDLNSGRPHASGYTSKNSLSNLEQFPGDRAVQHKQERQNETEKSHSKSITDSSEEYSTLDESSYNTTPPASRPPSQKGYFPPSQERKARRAKIEQAKPDIDTLPRQFSHLRSISTPEIQDLSCLPPLKHQSLRRKDKERDKEEKPTKSLIKRLPSQINKSEGSSPVSLVGSSQHLGDARLNFTVPRAPGHFLVSANEDANVQPIAKMLVICCSCRYFHDLPSKVYECMVKPDSVVRDGDLGVSGVISTAVKCPWCGHGMNTSCCEGYAAVVYLRERLH